MLHRMTTASVRASKRGARPAFDTTRVESIFLGARAFRKMLYRYAIRRSWSGCSLHAALHVVCLWPLLPLDDVELDFVALFERLVAIELNGAVVHEDVGPIIPADETIALRIVEPLHLAFVLGHVSVTSLQSRLGGVQDPACLPVVT